MIELSDLPGLHLGEDGIYYTEDSRQVSYPEAGHDRCFDVEDDSFWFQHRNRIIRLFADEYGVDKTFVDIGGGNGCVADFLQRSGYDVILLEPGYHGAANGRKRGVKRVICGALQDVTFTGKGLTQAGMFDVVEHIEDDRSFMRSVCDAMPVGGMLLITVPAYQGLWSYHDVEAGHYRRHDRRSLLRLCTEAGFTVEHSTYFFAPLVVPIWLQKTLPTKLGLAKADAGRGNQRTARQLKGSPGLLGKAVAKALDLEFSRLAAGKTIPIGSSLLAVARKSA